MVPVTAPVPVFTVTVRVVPLPVTPITEVPDMPVVMLKSAESTPVTDSLKVTVKFTLAAFVGFPSAAERTMEVTVGNAGS
jgi:hypothetical protein